MSEGVIAPSRAPVARLHSASLRLGDRMLWSGLDLAVERGEFLAILGPNGVGKTSLLRVLLGLVPLSSGRAEVLGEAPQGSSRVGYVPQQRAFDPTVPVRGRDLVLLGLDGHRWGFPLRSRGRHAEVQEALVAAGAEPYAERPLGLLSGGEQQRVRIAQAIVARPALLLCDEPLLSLDLASQRAVVAVLDRLRRERETTIILVTHEVNPILPFVDRLLYLAPRSWAVGTPDEILRSDVLSRLYGTEVEVLRSRGRVVVVGAPDEPDAALGDLGHPHRGDGGP